MSNIIITEDMSYTRKIRDDYLIMIKNNGMTKENPLSKLLSERRPDLYAQLHLKKNIDDKIDVSKLTCGSGRKVWWFCINTECGHHVWQDSVAHRVDGRNCSFCHGKRICICDSLYSKHPELMKEWDWIENDKLGLDPKQTAPTGRAEINWICVNHKTCDEHKWLSKVASRTGSGKLTGCPYCCNRLVCKCNSLYHNSKELMKEWDWVENDKLGLDPRHLSLGSSVKANWICVNHKTCDKHKWSSKICDRTRRSDGCPYCTNRSGTVCSCNSIYNTHPQLMSEWDWVENDKLGLDPKNISSGSNALVSWVCKSHKTCNEHKWKAEINNRQNGSQCSYCINRKVCSCNALIVKYPELMKEWDWVENNKLGLDPSNLSIGSSIKTHWICVNHKTCNEHKWMSSIINRTNGFGCPYCINRSVCSCNSLYAIHNSLIDKEWDWVENNKLGLDPKIIAPGSDIKANWICSNGCKYLTAISSRTNKNKPTGCPNCPYVNERLCRNIIEKVTNGRFPKSRPPWLEKLELDGYCKEKKIAFEYNGEQHYSYISHFHDNEGDFLKQRENDRRKIELCKQNSVKLIIIPYWVENINKEIYIRCSLDV